MKAQPSDGQLVSCLGSRRSQEGRKMDRVPYDALDKEETEPVQLDQLEGGKPQPCLTPKPHFKKVLAADVPVSRVEWLWKGRYAKGKLGSLLGDSSMGKTTLLCSIIADLTTGRPLPDDSKKAPVNCWIMSSEDAADDTLRPLLQNHGADLTRVWITDEIASMDKAGHADIEAFIREKQIGLLVIDALTTWMDASTDTGSFNEVATWLAPFKTIAQRTGCAIVFVRHKRKGGKNDNKMHAGLGSIAQVALFRTELSVSLRGDERWLVRTKGNIGPPPRELAYAISSVPGSDLGKLKWVGGRSANAAPNTTPKKLPTAIEWLRAQLQNGPQPAAMLIECGKKAGFSEKTLQRAKEKLGAASVREGKGGWNWTLPEEDDQGG
jgi:hypothetical protein